SFQSRSLACGSVARPFPDYARLSHREYGHRVGIFRVLDVLEKHGITATVALDAMTAAHYPYLVQHLLGRGCEIIGHGVSVSRMVNSGMSEEQEREYISESLTALTTATGSVPKGWLGPEYGESSRTPQLLAEAGISYVCDWTNDEQPYPLKAPQGEILALPTMLELDYVHAMADRKVTMDRYSLMLREGFDAMYEDGATNGRVMVLHLHPWLIGQPFRIGCLDEALAHMVRRQGVWAATGGEITDWYRQKPPVG
ncbi:MAG: polysaccharide deacetylase family protein, partial [Dehalococcoidia bacterium]|nr:polysaccharide deacetylase family protein [Dehalococcoidia bacterium]